MKKTVKIISITALALLVLLGALCVPILANNTSFVSTVSASSVSSTNQENAINIIPLSTTPPISGGDNEDLSNDPIYTEDGQRIGYIPETGMVVTENGTPVSISDEGVKDQTENSAVVLYDSVNQEFIDSANNKLSIFLDSKLSKNYLVKGGKYLISINMDREVVLVGFKTTSGEQITIYAWREKKKRGFWDTINPLNWGVPAGYRFYDMNGQQIQDKYLVSVEQTSFGAIVGQIALNPLWFVNLIRGSYTFPVVTILEKTTLRELYAEMEYATVHPWDRLMGIESGLPVVTKDSKPIYINPHTNQLTDFYGYALYNAESGLPIIYDSTTYDIITVDGKSQVVEDGVLLNSMTVWTLLQSGTEFYMGVVPTMYGSFDVSMLKLSDDPNVFDYILLNGESAQGIVLDHRLGTSQDGDSFGEWWSSIFGTGGIGSSIISILLTIGIIVLVIIFLPAIIPAVQAIFSAIGASFNAITGSIKKTTNKPKKQPYKNTYYKKNRKKGKQRK